MQKKFLYIFAALITIIIIEGVFLFATKDPTSQEVLGIEIYAERVIEKCAEAQYRPYCYEQKVPDLLDEIPVEDIFDVIRVIKQKDTSYQFCHVLAHELGTREVTNDPENWIDVIARGPADGLCSNGFIHGAAVARFSKEVLTDEEIDVSLPELQIACEARDSWNPTPLDQAICYHGMGHVLLHLTGAKIEKSLEICDEIAIKEDGRNYLRVCDEGVFMQIFQPLEPEDFALIEELPIKPTKETLAGFCADNSSDVAEESACWREGWPFFREELRTPGGITAFCANSSNEEQTQNCVTTALTIQGRHGLDKPTELAELCNALPADMQGQCFNLSAGAYIEEDKSASSKAVAFCAYAGSKDIEDGCYRHLIRMSGFIFGAQRGFAQELCEALPSDWLTQCMEETL